MPVLRCLVTPRLAFGFAAAIVWAPPAKAQDGGGSRSGPVWTLEGLRAGQCVRFLMDPRAAGKGLRPGARPLRADQVRSLHPALRSVVDAQPEFAPWAPASLCLFYADAIRIGARRFGSKDSRRSQMLALWTVAAVEPSGTRRDMVLDLFGSGGALVRAAELGKVKAKEARSAVSKAAGGENDLYDVRLGKTRLVWNGRAAGDSTSIADPLEELWLTRGASGTMWRIQVSLRPAWTRPLVGVLSVEGKDDLAKALKGSPTRFVGPLYYGGGGELRFSR
jgi:hypothetical protein